MCLNEILCTSIWIQTWFDVFDRRTAKTVATADKRFDFVVGHEWVEGMSIAWRGPKGGDALKLLITRCLASTPAPCRIGGGLLHVKPQQFSDR